MAPNPEMLTTERPGQRAWRSSHVRPQALSGAATALLDHQVCPSEELLERLGTNHPGAVDHDAVLVGVEVHEGTPSVETVRVCRAARAVAELVTVRLLDLAHVRTEVGEELGAVAPCDTLGQFDHVDPAQQLAHGASPFGLRSRSGRDRRMPRPGCHEYAALSLFMEPFSFFGHLPSKPEILLVASVGVPASAGPRVRECRGRAMTDDYVSDAFIYMRERRSALPDVRCRQPHVREHATP